MQKNIIELRNISKSYVKNVNVIDQLNLEVKKGEFVTILGPSGCGKTTILRIIGGFEMPSGGEIYLDQKEISKIPPNERPINTVFQNYALFPFMNVYKNIAFGLKLKKLSKQEIDQKIKRVLEIVRLEGYEKREITTLSGGQQQRVAIARAIVNEPDILLLDEPLGALDYKMRKGMQMELKQLHRELGITFIYVTHDQEEALTMSDEVAVISEGTIAQIGTPEEIYQKPSSIFTAEFIGGSNIFEGAAVSAHSLKFLEKEFFCDEAVPEGKAFHVMIRPEHIYMADGFSKERENQLEGKVISCVFKGSYYEITILVDEKEKIFLQNKFSVEPGNHIVVTIPSRYIHVIF